MRLTLSLTLALGLVCTMATADDKCDLDYKVKSIDGKTVDLEDYEGKVILVVNTASQCGLTPHYAGLEKAYQKYKEKGFVVLGFPCNQFGSQEPGTDADIKKFCSTKYKVTFPMFSKVEVNGDDATDFYKNLTSKDLKPTGKGPIGWNFEKFVIDREGHVVGRFASSTAPDDAGLLKVIESELKKK